MKYRYAISSGHSIETIDRDVKLYPVRDLQTHDIVGYVQGEFSRDRDGYLCLLGDFVFDCNLENPVPFAWSWVHERIAEICFPQSAHVSKNSLRRVEPYIQPDSPVEFPMMMELA